jgi:hypothetical protein
MSNNGITVTKGQRLTGHIVSALAAVFLLFDAAGKLFRLTPVVEGTVRLGYSEAAILPIGVVLTVCTILYLMPRTAILGAILLTGYLGGAVATHVRTGESAFAVSFPVMFGILLWGGYWLRDSRLRSLIPFKAPPPNVSV